MKELTPLQKQIVTHLIAGHSISDTARLSDTQPEHVILLLRLAHVNDALLAALSSVMLFPTPTPE